jgi:hypothetical protein
VLCSALPSFRQWIRWCRCRHLPHVHEKLHSECLCYHRNCVLPQKRKSATENSKMSFLKKEVRSRECAWDTITDHEINRSGQWINGIPRHVQGSDQFSKIYPHQINESFLKLRCFGIWQTIGARASPLMHRRTSTK